MPWYERWFYLDALLDEAKEAAEDQAFDPNKPWSGGHFSPAVAGGLGATTRVI